VRELIWLRGLVHESGMCDKVNRPLTIEDSRSLIDILESLGIKPPPKHFRRLVNFVRDEVVKCNISFVHVPGLDLGVDILTKSVPKPKLVKVLDQFCLLKE